MISLYSAVLRSNIKASLASKGGLPPHFGSIPPTSDRPIRMGLASLPHPVEARVESDLELSEKQDENSSFEMIPIASEAILPDLVILHQCSCVLCAMSFDHPIVTSLDVQDLMHDLRLAATTVTQKMLPPPATLDGRLCRIQRGV